MQRDDGVSTVEIVMFRQQTAATCVVSILVCHYEISLPSKEQIQTAFRILA